MYQVHSEDLADPTPGSRTVELFASEAAATETFDALVKMAEDGTWSAKRPYVSLARMKERNTRAMRLAIRQEWDVDQVIRRYSPTMAHGQKGSKA